MDPGTDLSVTSGVDQDALIRMVASEAANEPADAQQAVASTAVNRSALTGRPIATIATDAGQYNGVATPRFHISPTDPVYQKVAANLGTVFTDGPTVSDTHYYAPKLIAAPQWAKGQPTTQIGSQVFVNRSQDFAPSDAKGAVADYFGGSGTRQVTPAPGGGVKDPATGEVYTPDPAHPGQVLDASRKPFEFVNPADVVADFNKTQPKTAGPGDEPPATVGSVAAQGAQSLGDMATSTGHLALASNPFGLLGTMAGGAADRVGQIADLIRYGTGGAKPALPQSSALAGLQLSPGAPVPTFNIAGAPQNFPERVARIGAPMLAGAAFGPEAGSNALTQLGVRGANVALPTIGAVGANEGARAMNLPPDQQQIATILGGLAGGGAAGFVGGGAPAVARAADPFVANVSKSAAETQAGQRIANAATNFPTARSALENYQPLVPGSPATIGDATGDLGLIGLSRAHATKGSDAYAQLTGDQNQARTASLQTLSPNADPMALQQHIRGTIDNLDAQTQADVDAATTNAQAKAQAVGGQGNAEDYGSQIREGVQDALKASDAREKALWDAIDPDKSLTGNVDATKIAGKSIIGNVSQYDVPLNADEQRIFGQVQSMPSVMKLSDIVALRKSINDAASTEMATNGRTATYGRLSALRSALGENLTTTIGDAPGAASKLKAWNDTSGTPASQVASGVSGGGNQQLASGGPAISGEPGGTALPAAGGLGGSPSNPSLSGQISPDLTPIKLDGKTIGYTDPNGQQISMRDAQSYQGAPSTQTQPGAPPTIDAEAQGRMGAANAATAEQAQTFRQGPVAPVLKTTGYAGQFAMPAGKVPAQFFHPGPTGAEDMAALAKASPEAMPAIEDYAASTLQKMAADPDTGVITPKGFKAWQTRYADSIRALPPELQAKFADAATAGQTMADAGAARAEALKSAQSGAIGKILGAPDADAVTKYVGSVIRSPTGQADLTSLVNATKGNPDAFSGLKQAVVDHITNTLTSNTEAAASGVDKLRADQFQSFAKQKVPMLVQSGILTPAEGERLTNIAADIQQSQRTLGATRLAGQSNTAADLHATGLPKSGLSLASLLVDQMVGGAGALIGAHFHGATGGAMGELLGSGGAGAVQYLRAKGINTVNDLVQRATFDPKFALALTAKIKGPQDLTGAAGRALIRSLSAPAIAAASSSQKPAQAAPARPYALQGVQ